uniref:Uncharacterized protein n=1 Tax=Glossina pallidipes TaxID=7398 RepID=A0A1B0A225_GLOPL
MSFSIAFTCHVIAGSILAPGFLGVLSHSSRSHNARSSSSSSFSSAGGNLKSILTTGSHRGSTTMHHHTTTTSTTTTTTTPHTTTSGQLLEKSELLNNLTGIESNVESIVHSLFPSLDSKIYSLQC